MVLDNEFDFESFVKLIDNIYDEICIWDADWNCVYANQACYQHYGMRPNELLGKNVKEFIDRKLWYPTCVPDTYSEKKPVMQRQRTCLGIDIVTISVPIFDSFNNVKYIIQSVREADDYLLKKVANIPADKIITDDLSDSKCKIIYRSDAMGSLIEYSKKAAASKAPILILGETGTGKTMLARYIHKCSDRADKPFVNVNIASLSPSVIESELFGYEAGAFTGAASKGKKGIFEAANGGTLFLDELGEFPYDLQAKFLHVLQDEQFIPVGGLEPVELDVRILCATNCDIEKMIKAGRFRADLYHRINLIELTVPPLRERPEDILILSEYLLEKLNEKYGKMVRISDEVLDLFCNYTWSGNVRELSNVIERGIITADNDIIRVKNLPESFFSVDNIETGEKTAAQIVSKDIFGHTDSSFEEAREHWESQFIKEKYDKHPSSRKLARALDISQSKASRLIRKYIGNEL